jgi:class 3 adenylate cyclase
MSLLDELVNEVGSIFKNAWESRKGTVVPESEDLSLQNEGVTLDATVLYADLAESTHLVDRFKAHFSAEVYKAFLHCAAKIIRAEGGAITAYDGDRIMAVFIGDRKNTSAVRTALKINYAVKNIIGPALTAQYPNPNYAIRHVVGVDTSSLLVARTGARGANDLVWVGRAANYAAKLTELDPSYASNITGSVYKIMLDEAKLSDDGRPMWKQFRWTSMNDLTIYRSTWSWKV